MKGFGLVLIFLLGLSGQIEKVSAFSPTTPKTSLRFHNNGLAMRPSSFQHQMKLYGIKNDQDPDRNVEENSNQVQVYDEFDEKQEKARLEVWTNRRNQIRSTLRSAEKFRYSRISNGEINNEI